MKPPTWKCVLVGALALSLLVACGDDPSKAQRKPGSPASAVTAPASTPKPPPGSTGEDVALPAIRAFIDKSAIDTKKDNWRTTLPKPDQAVFSKDRSYLWRLDTTKGPLTIKLRADSAPMHATSTVYLTLLGFYDGLTFHRITAGSSAQSGCPNGDGSGFPGYYLSEELQKGQDYDRAGLVAAANRGFSTDQSQFLLMLGVPSPDFRRRLNTGHTLIGEVVEGAETLKAIDAAGSADGTPREMVVINKATIDVR